MTEKRFTTMWKPETTFSRFWIVRENWEKKLNPNDVVDLLNEQHEQIERLKQNFRALDEVKFELAEENEHYKSIFFELIETALTDKNCKELYCKGILDIFNKANSLNQAREMIKEHLE